MIDLEYGGPNHAAYDIANLFNEYIGCEEPLQFARDFPNEGRLRDIDRRNIRALGSHQERTKVVDDIADREAGAAAGLDHPLPDRVHGRAAGPSRSQRPV